MTTPRLSDLTGPPEIGRVYWVPTVRGTWHNETRNWPVIGPKHHDRAELDFPWLHYHIDPRFIAGREADLKAFLASPLPEYGEINQGGLGAPVLRRRKCHRHIAWPFEDTRSLLGPFACKWEGRRAERSPRGGWICPHRAVDLSDRAPDDDGLIICPLHGLRIRAADGVCMGPGHGPKAS